MYKRESRRPASSAIPKMNTEIIEEKTERIIPYEEIKQTELFEEPIVIPDYEENKKTDGIIEIEDDAKDEKYTAIPDISNDESESDINNYMGGGNSTYYKDSSLFRPENSKKSTAAPLTAQKNEPEKEPEEQMKESSNESEEQIKEPSKETETVPAVRSIRENADNAKSVCKDNGGKIVDKIFKTSFRIEDLVFYAILFLLVSGRADDEIVVIVGLFILAST